MVMKAYQCRARKLAFGMQWSLDRPLVGQRGPVAATSESGDRRLVLAFRVVVALSKIPVCLLWPCVGQHKLGSRTPSLSPLASHTTPLHLQLSVRYPTAVQCN